MRTRTRRLMAVKPHKYGTRHLTAGEEYEVPAKHALALIAAKKARYHEPRQSTTKKVEEPAPAAAAPETAPGIEDLRAQATALGVEVNHRWGTARLQYEINKATGGR